MAGLFSFSPETPNPWSAPIDTDWSKFYTPTGAGSWTPELAEQILSDDPNQVAAARIRQSVKPVGGRKQGLATVLPEAMAAKIVGGVPEAIAAIPRLWSDVSEGKLDPNSEEGIQRATGVAMSVGMLGSPFGSAVKGAVGSAGGRLAADLPKPSEGPFYSALQQHVENNPTRAASPEQWQATLKNAPIKKEELEDSGALDWLKGQEGPVTREALAAKVKEGAPQIKAIEKGGENNFDDLETEKDIRTEKLTDDLMREYYPDLKPEDPLWEHAYNNTHGHARNQIKEQFKNDTKYHEYQLPGGENYRETLLTTPEKFIPTPENVSNARVFLRGELNGDPSKFGFKTDNEIVAEAQRRGFSGKENINYKSSHWDEPNVLAHYRTNDRNIGGDRTLHAEEFQSDWHQAGRKEGYQQKEPEKLELVAKEIQPGWFEVNAADGTFITNVTSPDATAEGAIAEARRRMSNQPQWTGLIHKVPDAPFKKSWHELAFKHFLKRAVDDGYDAVSWTPGEAQAKRYDLNKEVNRIQYKPEEQKLIGYDYGGKLILTQENVKPEKLSDIIGNEVAEKLLKTENKQKITQEENKEFRNLMNFSDAERRSAGTSDRFMNLYGKANRHWSETGHELIGQNVSVGGQGMKGFYDKIMVDTANKLGKKFGAKVEQKDLNNKTFEEFKQDMEAMPGVTNAGFPESYLRREYIKRDLADPKPIHFMKITPAMRKEVGQRGFSLYEDTSPTAPLATADDKNK